MQQSPLPALPSQLTYQAICIFLLLNNILNKIYKYCLLSKCVLGGLNKFMRQCLIKINKKYIKMSNNYTTSPTCHKKIPVSNLSVLFVIHKIGTRTELNQVIQFIILIPVNLAVIMVTI